MEHECPEESATPVLAYQAYLGPIGFLMTCLVHDGHYHVNFSQSSQHETLDEARAVMDGYVQQIPPIPWHNAIDVMPIETNPIPFTRDDDE